MSALGMRVQPPVLNLKEDAFGGMTAGLEKR